MLGKNSCALIKTGIDVVMLLAVVEVIAVLTVARTWKLKQMLLRSSRKMLISGDKMKMGICVAVLVAVMTGTRVVLVVSPTAVLETWKIL